MIYGDIFSQRLTLVNTHVVADTIDYLEMKFSFKTNDWDGLEKWVHFANIERVYDIRLSEDGVQKEDHLNLTAGKWRVYLHGNRYENGQVIERITTDEAVIYVAPTGTLDGEPFPEIPASVTEQILARLEDVEQNGGGSGGQQAQIDDTLTKPGYAADAKAVGDALKKKLNADALGDAVEDALRQAKESGEFDGTPGTSPTVAVSEIAGGHRITITDKNGTKTVDVMDGTDGDPGAPGNDYVLTDADKTEIAEIAAGMVDVPEGGGGTSVEIDSTLTQAGKAADAKVVGDKLGEVSKEIADLKELGTSGVINQNGGGVLKIWAGTQAEYDALLVKDDDTAYLIDGATSGDGNTDETTYSVTNNLTNVTTDNSSEFVSANSAYTATLTPFTNYEIDSVVVYMGGTDVTETVYINGVVNIAAVTGDVVITATAILGEVEGTTSIYTFAAENVKSGIIGEDGTIATSTGYYVDEMIPARDGLILLKANEAIMINTVRAALYDADGTFMTRNSANGEATVAMISTEGATSTKVMWWKTNATAEDVDAVMTLRKLPTDILTKNGYYIDINGDEQAGNSSVSDYIAINTSDPLCVICGANSATDNTIRLAFYDSHKSFISRDYAGGDKIGVTVMDIPDNAVYYRVSGSGSCLFSM